MDSHPCDCRRTWSLGSVRIISAVELSGRKHIGHSLSGLPFLPIAPCGEITGEDENSFSTWRTRCSLIDTGPSESSSINGATRCVVLAGAQSFYSVIWSRFAVGTCSVVDVLCFWRRRRCVVGLAGPVRLEYRDESVVMSAPRESPKKVVLNAEKALSTPRSTFATILSSEWRSSQLVLD
jgi:hypothetical protein